MLKKLLEDPRVLMATTVAILTPLGRWMKVRNVGGRPFNEFDLGMGAAVGLLIWKLLGEEPRKSAWLQPALTVGRKAAEPSYHQAYSISSGADAKKSFEAVGDMLIKEVTTELQTGCEMPKREVDWVKRMLDYNVKGGKMNRGMMAVHSGTVLLKKQGKEVTPAVLTKLAVLGWCIEWLQAFFLILDDIMDASTHRRGQPCWYQVEDVKMIAINDGLLLEQMIYRLLKKHFGDEPYYSQLVDFFLETTFQTSVGQLLDTICDKVSLEEFTEQRWHLVCKYKTAYYSFYCPVALGMIVAGVKDKAAFDAVKAPLVQMGIYFQAQDDYLDAFGTLEQLGKVGTDIQDRKCSWLFVQAKGRVTEEQKKYLEKHYGKCKVGSAEEKEIKSIFEKAGLPEAYRNFEEKSVKEIKESRKAVEEANGLPWALVEDFLNKIYKRSS